MDLTLATVPEHSVMVANLHAWFGRATAEQVDDGRGWFSRARIECARIGIDYGIRTERVAAVVAVLSPRTKWHVNLEHARAIIAAAVAGEGCPPINLPDNRAKAWRIATGADIAANLRGQKVTRFYAAILGIDTVAVIDAWAVRAAVNDPTIDAPGAAYSRIADAYATVAEDLDIEIHDLQAIVWSAIRGTGR